MRRSAAHRLLTGGYLVLFFAYLFGPLFIMGVSAFNSSSFPRMRPWECFTTQWFERLAADDRLLEGLGNSLIIGVGVVLLATPIGLAAALWLSQVGPRLRSVFYTVFIAPILVPGVVLGISTLVFWDRLGTVFGAAYDSFFYDGIVLTILGQVTFISAYAMLVFLSRLQRFDHSQTEAALDLGASPGQAFRRILLPFLKPAIVSAAVLAFLASLENYNTTIFTIVSESTFTTVLASKVRYGIDPSISAVAVVIVALTLIGALVHESWAARQTAMSVTLSPVLRGISHPATVFLLLLGLAGVVLWAGSRYDSAACEARVLEEKRALQREFREPLPGATPDASVPSGGESRSAPGQPDTGFGGVFDPGNLGDVAPEGDAPAPEPRSRAPRPDTGFGGVFAPGNLGDVAPEDEAPAPAE